MRSNRNHHVSTSIVCIIILVIGFTVQQQEEAKPEPEEPHCMKFYRKDLLETWYVPPTSNLCNIDKPTYSSFYYGITAKGDDLFIMSRDIKTSINSMKISEKTFMGGVFSVAIFKENQRFSHFLTITPTEDQEKLYSFEYILDESQFNGQYRSTYYVKESDISIKGADTRSAITLAVILTQIFIVSNVLCHKKAWMQLGLAFNTMFIIPTSFILANFEFKTLKSLCITLGIVLLVAIVIAYLYMRNNNLVIGMIFGALFFLYYVLAGTRELSTPRNFFIVGVVLITGAIVWFNTIGTKAAKISYIVQYCSFWIQIFFFWAYLSVMTIPELWVRVSGCPSEYKVGISGKSFGSMILPWTTAFVILILQYVVVSVKFDFSLFNFGANKSSKPETLAMDSGDKL